MILPTWREVVAGVGGDLLLGQRDAGLVAAGGVADERRVVADDDDGRVAEVLKLAELAERDGVAEVDVDPGRVDPVLDPERRARSATERLELPGELGLGRDRVDPSAEDFELFGCADGHRGPPWHGRRPARGTGRDSKSSPEVRARWPRPPSGALRCGSNRPRPAVPRPRIETDMPEIAPAVEPARRPRADPGHPGLDRRGLDLGRPPARLRAAGPPAQHAEDRPLGGGLGPGRHPGLVRDDQPGRAWPTSLAIPARIAQAEGDEGSTCRRSTMMIALGRPERGDPASWSR